MPSPTLSAVHRVAEAQPSYLPSYCLLCHRPLVRGPREQGRKRHPLCAKAWEGVRQAEWRRKHPGYRQAKKYGEVRK